MAIDIVGLQGEVLVHFDSIHGLWDACLQRRPIRAPKRAYTGPKDPGNRRGKARARRASVCFAPVLSTDNHPEERELETSGLCLPPEESPGAADPVSRGPGSLRRPPVLRATWAPLQLTPEPSSRFDRLAESIDEDGWLFTSFAQAYAGRRRTLEQMVRAVTSLARNIAPGAELQGRVKTIESIWRNMRAGVRDGDQVMDSIGVRVILPRTRDCYRLIEQIHRRFEIVAGEYDDYIKYPKPNGYRSLHTVIVGPEGYAVELQVRTGWMHELAERGPAAHWRYKRQRLLIDTQQAPDRARIADC